MRSTQVMAATRFNCKSFIVMIITTLPYRVKDEFSIYYAGPQAANRSCGIQLSHACVYLTQLRLEITTLKLCDLFERSTENASLFRDK
ncbi:hypothetical protein KDK_08950 [Dictyobacter kobayashii]|uniref:Uncharacterized protein n=1 Tax=Dictyobacter kobayashii TaxID=2014872 RepID=A0A402ADC2_9CHLR|nr:hypothetical protein KDK_08950 [Dictyobacter kobayashii]